MGVQDELFPDPHALKSRVISRRKDFDSLFEGFTRLRAVSYVASADLLLEFLDRRGYESVELVLGESLSQAQLRQILAEKGVETAQRLAELQEQGKLRILVPEKTIHTKLYLLEKPGFCRVIITSANFTETARAASRQVNYAWYADLPAGHPWLARVEEDYKAHAHACTLFMGDLAELLKKDQGGHKREIIEAWLKGAPAEEVDQETRRLHQEISRLATLRGGAAAEPVLSVKLPESPAARKHAERLLAPLDPLESGGELRLNGARYLRFVQENHGLPILRVDMESKEVRLGLDGTVEVLTEPLPDPAFVDAALAHLESYIQTVDLGRAPDPKFAKVAMFEGLLYLLSAPFANENMKLRRRRFGDFESRGPSFLYIYGPSQNGKSTFLKFALKLIAGKSIEPANGGEFTKRKVLGAALIGTSFPLAFDDLVLATRYSLFEEVLKSYWEAWWSEDSVSPQIILSSNTYSLRDWAKSRVKRLDFDVQFVPSGESKEKLARIFRTENRAFRWFTHLYFRHLERPEPLSDDDLDIARRVFLELYRHAGRPVPEEFPREPIESLYDQGRRAWNDLLHRVKKARVDWEGDRATIHFKDDMQHHEIREYQLCLPPGIKLRRRGKALVVETPGEFRAWLEGGRGPQKNWLMRLLRR